MKISIIRALTMFVFACILCGSSTAHATQKVLNVPFDTQEEDHWCWAASAKMVMEYKGVIKEQCQIAGWQKSWEYTGIHDDTWCCEGGDGDHSDCDENMTTGAAGGVNILVNYGGLCADSTNNYLPFISNDPSIRTVVSTIEGGDPIGVVLTNYEQNGIAHAVVIDGYSYVDGANGPALPWMVHYNDPLSESEMPYWGFYSGMVVLWGWQQSLWTMPCGCGS